MIRAFHDEASSILILDDICLISTFDKSIYKLNLKVNKLF